MRVKNYKILCADLIFDRFEAQKDASNELGYLLYSEEIGLSGFLMSFFRSVDDIISKKNIILKLDRNEKRYYKIDNPDFIEALPDLLKILDYYSEHQFSPLARSFINCYKKHNIRELMVRYNDVICIPKNIHRLTHKQRYLDAYNGNKEDGVPHFVDTFNNFINDLYTEFKSEYEIKKQASLKRYCHKQYSSIKELITYALRVSDNVLVLRIDLQYKVDNCDFLRDQRQAGREWQSLDPSLQIQRDLKRLLDQKRTNSLFKHLLGYCWKLEKGLTHHLHTIWLYNGQHEKDAKKLARDLGKLWQTITCGNGVAWDCQQFRGERKAIGIGLLKKNDKAAQLKLFQAIELLCQKDLLVRAVPPRGQRLFARSAIVKKAKQGKTRFLDSFIREQLEGGYFSTSVRSLLPPNRSYPSILEDVFAIINFIEMVKCTKSNFFAALKVNPQGYSPKSMHVRHIAEIVQRITEFDIVSDAYSLNRYHPYIGLFVYQAKEIFWVGNTCLLDIENLSVKQVKILFEEFIKTLRQKAKSSVTKNKIEIFLEEAYKNKDDFIEMIKKNSSYEMICIDLGYQNKVTKDNMKEHLHKFSEHLAQNSIQGLKAYLGKTRYSVTQGWCHFFALFFDKNCVNGKEIIEIEKLWNSCIEQPTATNKLYHENRLIVEAPKLTKEQERAACYLASLSVFTKTVLPAKDKYSLFFMKELD